MNRIKLNPTGKQVFTAVLPVRITDINYGNHLGNHAFAAMVHEARVQWLGSMGFTELNVQGTGLIMAALAIEFKKEVFYGDTVTIDVYAEAVSRAAFNLYYELKVGETAVAVAKTEMVCYNYSAKKVVAVPDGLLDKM